MRSSRCQLSYLAQALKRQFVIASSSPLFTKIGPESRSHTRSVCQWWKWSPGEVGPSAAEQAVGAALGGEVVDEDVDVFDAGEMADDLGVDPRDGLELAGPVLGVVGPGDPGGGVRLPFGGHAVLRLHRVHPGLGASFLHFRTPERGGGSLDLCRGARPRRMVGGRFCWLEGDDGIYRGFRPGDDEHAVHGLRPAWARGVDRTEGA